jgi:glycosyltransferase involved in cell wall biosynthesis
VSVCILSFNRLQYLKQTLESFTAACTYPNLEYVAVDNGSCEEVVAYLRGLPYIEKMIFNTDNRGIGHAMNQAREAAEGDYYFNLENDWLFFYKGEWLQRGVRLFERDREGLPVEKTPEGLPLGLVKFTLGARAENYTNNPSLMSARSYHDVGPYPQYGRDFQYVSEDVHRVEPYYIKRYREKYACTVSQTPCAVHIGGYTTNPNYGNRGKLHFKELDQLLKGELAEGKWWLTYQYMKLGNRWKIRNALRRYRRLEKNRSMSLS